MSSGEKDNPPFHRRARRDSISGSDFYGGIAFSPLIDKNVHYRKSGKHKSIRRTVTVTATTVLAVCTAGNGNTVFLRSSDLLFFLHFSVSG